MVLSSHYYSERYVKLILNNRIVHVIQADYNCELPYYGNGWLRVLQFNTFDKKIFVKTYSPYINIFKTGCTSKFKIGFNF